MNADVFTWLPAYREPVIVIATVALAYCAYHYGTNAANFQRVLAGRRVPFGAQASSVMLERMAGFVLLGVVPAVIGATLLDWMPWDRGLAWPTSAADFAVCVLVPALALFPVLWAAARNPRLYSVYPSIRVSGWSASLVAANTATWALYLIGYEFFFRCFLLWSLVWWLGTWPGIAITTALYTFVHLPKHAGEGVGSLFMGVVFAGIALLTGSVLAPILLHVYLAATTDFLASRRPAPSA